MSTRTCSIVVLAAVAVTVAVHGCGDDETSGGSPTTGGDGSTSGPDLTGKACEAPADCYPGVDQTKIAGEVMCLDRVRDGYCTHTCTADDECCATPGECEDGFAVVCSPFESTGDKMCFLSCEEADLVAEPGQSGPVDEQEYCQRKAGKDFICRSSGGGSENRKVCVPGDCGVGATCGGDADCATGLTCITALKGGYCTRGDCATDADCPADSLCIQHTDGKPYCFRTCASEFDCSFCRDSTLAGACSDAVEFLGPATGGTVCTPP